MKKFILSITIFFLSNVQSFSHVEHYKNFNYLEYELFRNDKSIGYHKYNFIRDGKDLSIISEVSFKITKLGVDLYKYFAKSEENYENSLFKSYSSTTNQNNKEKYVNISVDPKDNNLIIDGTSYKGKGDKELIVGTWWNHEIVKANGQISGISGRIIKQTVTFIGKEKIKIGDKTYKTLRFNFKSSDETLPDNKKLNTDIWYDSKSLIWLKAQFVKQGNWEYRLKKLN